MRFRKWWVRLGAAAMLALVLCFVAAIYWLTPRSYQWRDFSSPDHQFRLSLPGTASNSQRSELSADKRSFVSYEIRSSPAKRVLYAVNWWENPAQQAQTTEELFAHLQECGVSAFHAAPLGEKQTTIQGHQANIAVFMAGDGLMIDNLVVRVGPRIYSLWVVDPELIRETKNVQRFFSSFNLL